MRKYRFFFIFLLVGLLGSLFCFGFFKFVDLEELNRYRGLLMALAKENSLLMAVFYFMFCFVIASFSLPGTLLVASAGGFVFGVIKGTVLVSFALTSGAVVTFFCSRFLLRDFFMKKFTRNMKFVSRQLKEDGPYYLFALRVAPFVPFFVTNVLMGLSSMKTRVFFFVSFLGLLPGIILYVNMGSQLSRVQDIQSFMSLEFLLSFFLLGVLPLSLKKTLDAVQKIKRSRDCSLESETSLY